MSTAKRRSRKSRRGQAGYSLIEVSMVLVIVAMMSWVVERTLATATEAERWLGAVRTSTERGQRVAYSLREIVSASRKLYSNDAVGQAYFDALELSRDPVASNARLPLIDEVAGLGPDAMGDPKTGNVMFFVREADAAPAIANPVTKKVRYVDTYRFVCVYPSETSVNVLTGPGVPTAWDLVIWRSEPFPSHTQIMEIQNPLERQSVIKDLYNRFGYEFAWDANNPVDDSFYAMDSLGSLAGTATPGLTIQEDEVVSERGRLVYAKVQLATTDNADYNRRAIFSVDDPNSWTPHGFELKIVGASGSRKVWINLVVETEATRNLVAVQACTVIASTRDL